MTHTESSFREQEKKRGVDIIKNSSLFNGDKGGKNYCIKGRWLPKADLLLDGKNNLYHQIVDDVIMYYSLINHFIKLYLYGN